MLVRFRHSSRCISAICFQFKIKSTCCIPKQPHKEWSACHVLSNEHKWTSRSQLELMNENKRLDSYLITITIESQWHFVRKINFKSMILMNCERNSIDRSVTNAHTRLTDSPSTGVNDENKIKYEFHVCQKKHNSTTLDKFLKVTHQPARMNERKIEKYKPVQSDTFASHFRRTFS